MGVLGVCCKTAGKGEGVVWWVSRGGGEAQVEEAQDLGQAMEVTEGLRGASQRVVWRSPPSMSLETVLRGHRQDWKVSLGVKDGVHWRPWGDLPGR